MARKKQITRKKFTPPEDTLVIRLNKSRWSKVEIAFRLFEMSNHLRSPEAIQGRMSKLAGMGRLKSVGKNTIRYATQEALDWCKGKFKGVNGSRLEITEEMPSVKPPTKRKPEKKAKAREVLGLTRAKGTGEPNPSYTAKAVLISRMEGDPLGLFRDLLESAVAEGKTAPDIIDDLRLVAS